MKTLLSLAAVMLGLMLPGAQRPRCNGRKIGRIITTITTTTIITIITITTK